MMGVSRPASTLPKTRTAQSENRDGHPASRSLWGDSWNAQIGVFVVITGVCTAAPPWQKSWNWFARPESAGPQEGANHGTEFKEIIECAGDELRSIGGERPC